MVISQVCCGLAYLNDPPRRIIHYDLKPANIMFDALGQVKLTVRPSLYPSLPPSRGMLLKMLLYNGSRLFS